ncbi:MAG TPA: sugar ABC transporter permease [Nocardioidaceae bacterium]|nr:sugar ABC transporter permease [Nocardioidaceae bacterium]
MQHGKYRFIAGFLAVPLGLYSVFVIWPFLQTFFYSFTNWTGLSPEFEYVGFQNFELLWDDTVFRHALRNNIVLLIGLPVLTVFIALLFAFLLNVGGSGAGVRSIRGHGSYKLAFFLPQVLSVPVIALVWLAIFRSTPDGLANSALGAFGLGPYGWLADPAMALYCLLWVLIWGSVGFYLVLFNAAISSVPRDLFEAAFIDGAGRASTFFRVTMPLLWDTIQTSWVYLAILALDGYALVLIMTIGPGNPDSSTQVMALQIAQAGFENGKAGYASAMGVVMFLLTLVVAATLLRLTRRERIEY